MKCLQKRVLKEQAKVPWKTTKSTNHHHSTFKRRISQKRMLNVITCRVHYCSSIHVLHILNFQIQFNMFSSMSFPNQARISHLHKFSTSNSIVLLPIELQCWRFNPNKVWPNFVRKGTLLFDKSQQPDKESTCKLS